MAVVAGEDGAGTVDREPAMLPVVGRGFVELVFVGSSSGLADFFQVGGDAIPSLGSLQMIGCAVVLSDRGIDPSGSSVRTATISSDTRARPKSVILSVPSSVTSRLPGLISR